MPTVRSQPSLDETEAVARELFTQFTRDQFTNEGLTPLEIEEQFQQLRYSFNSNVLLFYYYFYRYLIQILKINKFENVLNSSTNGYSIATPLMASVGRDLRRISEAFARSAEREQVRDRASRV